MFTVGDTVVGRVRRGGREGGKEVKRGEGGREGEGEREGGRERYSRVDIESINGREVD